MSNKTTAELITEINQYYPTTGYPEMIKAWADRLKELEAENKALKKIFASCLHESIDMIENNYQELIKKYPHLQPKEPKDE